MRYLVVNTSGDGPEDFVKNIEGSAKYQVGIPEVPLLQKLHGCEGINKLVYRITSIAKWVLTLSHAH